MKSRPFKSVKNKIKAIILKLDLLLKNSEKRRCHLNQKTNLGKVILHNLIAASDHV
jgi:hypothetical protein